MRRALKIRWRNRRRWSEDRKLDTSFVIGAFLFALGWGWVYRPLLFIVGGFLISAIAWMLSKAPPARRRSVDADVDEDN